MHALHRYPAPSVRPGALTRPAGSAAKRVSGRFRAVLALLGLSVVPMPLVAQIAVPSGQEVTFQDEIWSGEDPARVARFRFVAPAIARNGNALGFPEVEADMAHLCEVFVLPQLNGGEQAPARIIISLSDRPVPFGLADPEATQFFEAYRPDHGNCVWEGF